MSKSALRVVASTRPKLVRDPLADLARSFERSLRAKNRSEHTIASYMEAVRQFGDFLKGSHRPPDPALVERADVELFTQHLLAKFKPSTAANRFRSLQQFFKWCVEEEEIGASPMPKEPPDMPEVSVPVLSQSDLTALFKTVKGKDFEAVRDHALLDLFVRTGARRAEIMNLRFDQDNPADPERNDIDLERRTMTVLGKGRRPRTVGLDPQTVKSLDRYVRGARARHHKAHLPWLWLANQGRLSDNGLYQMVRRRAKLAGLAHVHPHQFRHGFADQWLRQGGTEGALMENAGWRNPAMLKRYGASLREDRATSGCRMGPC
jgi:site-specific recombinase XerD